MNLAVVHQQAMPTAVRGEPERVSSVLSPPGAFGVVDELPVQLLRLLGVELLAALR
eukprot:CAMPEP_0204609960 /NCGR_PEP_ID=MMETSP0661-20131031/61232_1 /ASSEMBLY_ACC=CAM_ASM_000606 /TAXON_ID=109239 /ORGANISM="Alexandrium margalefi, Strain AMGDE01CS-322" /LENGTH=55 /DNA_ID=CAMNT_0051621719 /DNA_START=47 /DNA_END=211 /DNA_ORIENTATION=+